MKNWKKISLFTMFIITLVIPNMAEAAPTEGTWDKYQIAQVFDRWNIIYKSTVSNENRPTSTAYSVFGAPEYRILSDGTFEVGQTVGGVFKTFTPGYYQTYYPVYTGDSDGGYTKNYGVHAYQIEDNGKTLIDQYSYQLIGRPWGDYSRPENQSTLWTAKYEATAITKEGKGTLIQSNIVAPIGAYPVDGKYSDGFWYTYLGPITNYPPVAIINQIDQTPLSNQQTLSITGTVQDRDNDQITISATINGKTKTTTVTNTEVIKNWTLTWNISEIAEGKYSNIVVTITDGK